ncbi:protein-L-isoaspartate(D-aspartate) O-methyltransferase [Sideroxydans lithotrophicus]|uniref:Protein-L-isoaspartate O-methyltransferase n=1 Tax=Sideroxydans lithotrophicus (strain ES-1) TaxID=580332 RepID=D5CR49_SIDLE|nr:protein-L-isoaspartate(D-aspartate) O-methyltransferase [Sideroxydans lithotrophicus]ADE11435.1 protein-L-isoaspartate O-methyltransferase [Sideroxydans lithotrophicus ES-1]
MSNEEEERYARARHKMVEEIREMALEAGAYEPAPPISARVLAVMSRVPRHRFVPEAESYSAYFNHPLPIGHGQTISQPYIVALMTDLLQVNKQHSVLEIGTGSGYQAAVLSELAGKVYSIEIVEPLAAAAAKVLRESGYANVEVKAGDGSLGWPEHAPYDGIIVTAAAEEIPQLLLDQLKPGGRMVIPVGGYYDVQQLLLISKDREGNLQRRNIEPVRFVPLTGGT